MTKAAARIQSNSAQQTTTTQAVSQSAREAEAASTRGPQMQSAQGYEAPAVLQASAAPVLDKLGMHAARLSGVAAQSTPSPVTNRVTDWFNKGPKDGVEGTRADEAYQVFNLPEGLSPKPVIVAVIDSGVDINHEDLRGAPVVKDGVTTYPDSRIYENAGEVEGDGIDNDGDGYVDNKYGWNFLGGYDAEHKPVNLVSTRLEVTREYLRLRDKERAGTLTEEEKPYYAYVSRKVPRGSTDPRYDLERDRRKEVIGDNPYDFNDRFYGNTDMLGSDGYHGTHVSGIIAAVRNNSKGVMGVAADVKIMPVRAVPNGDESDKDVANAIRYAADHGAQIINMSFGKAYASSPEGKKAVDAAVEYAKAHGVKLFVHAAGNESENMDVTPMFGGRYPNDRVGDDRKKEMTGWVEVGASTTSGSSAYFSNYGKSWVDVFAPGSNILSTVPGSRYETASGTSMASPVFAGVAAVVLSVFPDLTSEQLEEAVTKSVRPLARLQGKARNAGVADVVQALEYAGKLLGRPLPKADAAKVA